ncbi:MAG: right-handed parallel beta-helix repeat-containing protein, partial [Pseudomonadota bacterium]
MDGVLGAGLADGVFLAGLGDTVLTVPLPDGADFSGAEVLVATAALFDGAGAPLGSQVRIVLPEEVPDFDALDPEGAASLTLSVVGHAGAAGSGPVAAEFQTTLQADPATGGFALAPADGARAKADGTAGAGGAVASAEDISADGGVIGPCPETGGPVCFCGKDEGADQGADCHTHMDGHSSHGMIEDNNAFLMAMGEGSRIEIHGADAAKESFTKLTAGARHSKEITLDAATGWEVGDRIAVSSTQGKRMRSDEDANEYVITGVSADGKTFTLDKGLIWNTTTEIEVQTDGTRTWEIDMRTDVALLSRNVKIQGDDDSITDGYGGHTMIMHGAEQHISGAEFFRMGQIDELGRYPIHWHMLDDVAGQYVQNVSVHESFNKGMTIHGSHNARLQDNVIFDHIGHGVFLEDGSEYGSQILGNIVFGTQASKTGLPIPTDKSNVSSYWIENGNTVMVGNIAAGSDSVGFWITPAKNGPHGASKDVYTDPDELETWGGSLSNLVFRDNVAHTNNSHGLFTEGFIREDLTATLFRGGKSGPGELLVENFTAYNSHHGLWAGSRVFIDDSVFAGNRIGTFFHNDSSVVNDSLYLGATDTTAHYYGSTGAFLYRNADSGFNDVHFMNFAGENHEAFDIRTGTQQTPTWVKGLSFDNVQGYRVSQHERNDLDSPWASDNRIVDLDGSLTGQAGTFVTRKYLNEGFGGFTTSEDAKFEDSYLTQDGYLFMTRIQHQFAKNADGSPTNLLVTREDGVTYDQFVGQGRNTKTMQTAGMNDRESAYLVEFDALPTYLNINTVGMREGAAVVYQIPNFSRVAVRPEDAVTVTSLAEMFASATTAMYHDGSTIFLRVVAVPVDGALSVDAMVDNQDSPAREFLTDLGTPTGAGVRLYNLRGVPVEDRVGRG